MDSKLGLGTHACTHTYTLMLESTVLTPVRRHYWWRKPLTWGSWGHQIGSQTWTISKPGYEKQSRVLKVNHYARDMEQQAGELISSEWQTTSLHPLQEPSGRACPPPFPTIMSTVQVTVRTLGDCQMPSTFVGKCDLWSLLAGWWLCLRKESHPIFIKNGLCHPTCLDSIVSENFKRTRRERGKGRDWEFREEWEEGLLEAAKWQNHPSWTEIMAMIFDLGPPWKLWP